MALISWIIPTLRLFSGTEAPMSRLIPLSFGAMTVVAWLAAVPPDDPAFQAIARQAAALKPTAAELRYLDMPWVIDLNEALRQARAENRPLFFWAAGGRDRDGIPLERC
jgi:hypothetical protein